MQIEPFFHEPTSTLSYVVHADGVGVVIDPVRDYEARSGRTSWRSAERIARFVADEGLRIPYAIDTHAHADHLSGLPLFAERFGARTVTGRRVGEIQAVFRDFYDLGDGFPVDGSQFDVLLDEGERLDVGPFQVDALHTPGHTPAHMSWRVRDAVFIGDTLFAPDYGTARCDFPGGSAAVLYDSIQRLYALPDATRLFLCHDYRPGGRPVRHQTTVAEQKRDNVQLDQHTTRDDYVAFREKRDAELEAPELILPSLQVNVRAGRLPDPAANGTRYLKLPLDRL